MSGLNTNKVAPTRPINGSLGFKVTSLTNANKQLKENNVSGKMTKNNIWAFSVDCLDYDPQYDFRLLTNPEYYESDEVALTIDSIKQTYLKGEKVEAISISFIEGKPTVTGGFKRYRAAIEAQKSTTENIKVSVFDAGNSEEEILCNYIRSNDVERYSILEYGLIFFALMQGHGKSTREIANKFGKTETQVKAYIETTKAPDEIKEMLINKDISDTQWKRMVSEFGEKEALSIAITTQKQVGKVTDKKIKSTTDEAYNEMRVGVKKLNKCLSDSLIAIKEDIKDSVLDEEGNSLVKLSKEKMTIIENALELLTKQNSK